MCSFRMVTVAAVLLATACVVRADKNVEVVIAVLSAAGEPLGDVPLQMAHGPRTFFGRTDQNGTATLLAAVPDTTDKLIVTFSAFGDPDGSVAQIEADRQRYRQIVDGEAYPDQIHVAISENVTTYEVEFRGRPAIVASGRLVDANGAPVRGYVSALGCATEPAFVEADGLFVLRGIPRGEAVHILCSVVRSSYRRPVALSALQTVDDTLLGDIQVSPPSGEPTTIVLLNREALTADAERVSSAVTVISSEGNFVGIYGLDSTNAAREPAGDGGPVMLPAGVYYLCPGRLATQETPRILWRAILAGQDLSSTSVPRLVVVQSTPATIAVDAEAAVAACRALE